MTDGSIVKGNSYITNGGVTNLNITGTNSYWYMTENSQVSNLALDGSNVNIGDQAQPSTLTNNVTLTVGELSGNGVFHMRTSIIDSDHDVSHAGVNVSDKLNVIGQATGNHKVSVNDSMNGNVIGTEKVRMIDIGSGNAKFSLVGGYIDVGAYRYTLEESLTRSAKHWFLTPSKRKTNIADQSANVININYLVSYLENQTLLQRMGELRDTQKGDAWV